MKCKVKSKVTDSFDTFKSCCCQKIVGRWFSSTLGYNEDKNTTYLTQIDFKMVNCWLPVPYCNNYYSNNNNTATLTPTATARATTTTTTMPTMISSTAAPFLNQFVSNNVTFLSLLYPNNEKKNLQPTMFWWQLCAKCQSRQ